MLEPGDPTCPARLSRRPSRVHGALRACSPQNPALSQRPPAQRILPSCPCSELRIRLQVSTVSSPEKGLF